VEIYVDADGCPVKQEVFRVAKRYGLPVHVVANGWLQTPDAPRVRMVVVGQGLDAADDWIVEHAGPEDVVVTADVPLAARCVARKAAVLHPNGRPFTEDDVGGALALRDLLARLRESGARTGGPAPFRERDRSQFLQALDAAIQRGSRKR
jgi:uncharacterized protein YaiI (UPF0178 family)